MHERCAKLAQWASIRALAIFMMAAAGLLVATPFLVQSFESLLGLAPGLAVIVSFLLVVVLTHRRRFGAALVASSAAIGSMLALAGACLFPRLVPSSTDLAYSLTAFNNSSTPGTLTAMLVIALIGMPIVIAYTIYVHWVFRGKVKEGEAEY